MAGLYALHFLEEIDKLLGRNHLFKHSIILIKAWLYYESRILGAHHGLLSTYAVEILVLYIVNRFHSSVGGPLEVLYTFLDYYGKFDWKTNYISVDGPKALSTLPEIVETPECDQAGFLLSKEFLRSYRDMSFVQATSSGTKTNEFPTKFMNILDPLKSNNNLGRSVSIGNLHRIKMALSYGAQKLKDILMLPGAGMGAGIEHFFKMTLDRNGKGARPDVDVPVATFGTGRSEESDLRGDCDSYYVGLQHVQSYHDYAVPLTAHASFLSSPSLADMHALPTYYHPMGNDIYALGQTHYHPNAPHATYYLEENLTGSTLYYPNAPQETYSLVENVPAQTLYHPNAPQETYSLVENAPAQTLYQPTAPQETYSLVENAPAQTLYQPTASQATYSLDKNVKSRGTGPYIPDMTRSSYRDLQARATKPRRYIPGNRDVLPKSPLSKQSVKVEVLSETDTDDKSRSFELANEDFPVLPTIRKTNPAEGVDGNSKSTEEFPPLPSIRQTSEAIEAVKLTGQARNLSSSQLTMELSNKKFPVLRNIRKTSPSEPQGSVKLAEQTGNSSLPKLKIELTDEEFPLLSSICKTSQKKSQGSVMLTGKGKNSSPSLLKTVLMNEEFPPLPSIRKAKSEGQSSVQLHDEAKSFSSSLLKIEFGTYSKSKSLTKPSWPAKDEKEGSGVLSSGGTMLAVPKVAEEGIESDEDRSWIDSI
ncbi:putative PAP/25A-associated [Lupinus albus]|uniref:Putative PAP/25A-associated n=1 Tax=Lupinus albus TaxID=3870 RepID=A0A6A4Q4I0_LUPAL|nr:putative PAP/25A-associated [Lupinus albus]